MRLRRDLTVREWHAKVRQFCARRFNTIRHVAMTPKELAEALRLPTGALSGVDRQRREHRRQLLLQNLSLPVRRMVHDLETRLRSPGRAKQRTLRELNTYITLAKSGSTRHARAVLDYFYWIGPRDPSIRRYIEETRKLYNTDADREHRGIERALRLLDQKGGSERSTPDQRTEACQLYDELREPGARFNQLDECGHCQDLENNSRARSKAKRGMSKGQAIEHIAALMRTAPRTVQRWLTAASDEPE